MYITHRSLLRSFHRTKVAPAFTRSTPSLCSFRGFSSDVNGSKKDPNDSNDATKNDPNLDDKNAETDNGTKSSNNLPETKEKNDISQFKVKHTSSVAAPAPMDAHRLAPLLKQDNKPYIPKLNHERLSFEYPGLPNEDEYIKQQTPVNYASRWKRHIPKLATVGVVLWAAYAIKVWVFDEDEPGKAAKELLSPDEFHPFIVTHKEQIDDDHFLIEIKPKYDRWQYSYANDYENKSIWNGNRLWSVEIKHPQIMVVRSYTPLPLYFLKSELTRKGDRKPLLKVINNDAADCDRNGTMVLYVKRYEDGELSKYICLREIGNELELRGPDIEYTFPYSPTRDQYQVPIFRDLPSSMDVNRLEDVRLAKGLPPVDNVVFYGAGTGVAPILQSLMLRNPYAGFVTVHYSARNEGELKPLERLLFFLNKLDRLKFVPHYDTSSRLSGADFVGPETPNYVSDRRKIEFEKSGKLIENMELKAEDIKNEEQRGEVVYSGARFETALEQALVSLKKLKQNPALAIVCGPDGYLEYVSGLRNKLESTQGPITGELAKKGWDNTNVFKL